MGILVVDSDVESARAVCEALGRAGCEAVATSSADEAEALLVGSDYGILILEIDLSGGNGLDLLARVRRARREELVVIVFTHHGANDLLRRRAVESGAAEFLGKGMGFETLCATVGRYATGEQSGQAASQVVGNYILVVDDEAPIRRYISRFFEHKGFETKCAYDAESAKEIILAEQPMALMLDIEMPGRSGLQLLRELNVRGIKPPTVIITGVQEHEIGIEAESLGVIGFLPKPCNISYMTQTILPKIELLTR